MSLIPESSVSMLRLAILIALSCVTSALQMQRPPLLHARACLPGRARCGQHAMALDGFLLLSEAAVPTVAGAGGAPTANELVKIGASLAATSILATVLVGFIVSANYDNIEVTRTVNSSLGACTRAAPKPCATARTRSIASFFARRLPCTRSRTLRGRIA